MVKALSTLSGTVLNDPTFVSQETEEAIQSLNVLLETLARQGRPESTDAVDLMIHSRDESVAIRGGVLTAIVASFDRPGAEALWASLVALSPHLAGEAGIDIEGRLFSPDGSVDSTFLGLDADKMTAYFWDVVYPSL